MWSRHVDDSNLVALFIVGIKYFDCIVDMKLLPGRFELSIILILKCQAKITNLIFRTIVRSHISSSCSINSKILPVCGR